MRAFLALVALLVLAGFSFSVDVGSCITITSSGTYTLNQSVSGFPNTAAPAAGSVCIKIGAPNVVFDCQGFSVNGNHTSLTYGILTNISATNVTVQNCYVQGFEGGLTTVDTNGSFFRNIASYNNTLAGFFITSVGGGFSNFDVFDNNSAYQNSPYGFYIVEAGHSNITNSNSFGNSIGYYFLGGGHDDLLSGDSATGNSGDGFNDVAGNDNNQFVNDVSSGNGGNGFLFGASGLVLNGSTASGNTGDGVKLSGSIGTAMDSNHLYDNGRELRATTGTSYTATGTVFDNPAGNFQDYTNLSINDTTGSEEYTVSWSSIPATLPTGASPFNNKYVSIVPVSGFPVINSATWSWLPSEVGPFTESGVQLWEYHSGWTPDNVTPDTANHRLSLTNIAGFSVFALLVNNNVSAVKVDVTPLLPSPGGMTQWQINVSNTGSGPLDPVAVTDTLPSGLQFVSATPAPDSVSPDNLTVDWTNVGPLAAGASTLILLNASVDANASNGTYFNSVNVTATPLNASDVTASDSTPIGIYAPALSVVKSLVNGSPVTGLNTTFTINVTNTGSINLTISIVDLLPANCSFRGSDVPPTAFENGTSGSGGSVNWTNLTVLPVGASTVITYNVSFTVPGTYANNVSVTGAPPNGNSVTDNSSATASVSAPVPQGGDNQGPAQTLSVHLSSNCTANLVTVTSGGPVEGADVLVDGNSIGTTDQNGQVSFQGCGSSVTIRASKSGYDDGVTTVSEVACGQCAPPPVCTTNADCPSDQFCQVNANSSLNQCVPVSCPGGSVVNHACVVPQNQTQPPPQCNAPSCCTSDSQCLDTHACVSASGAPGSISSPGSCQQVSGQCGFAANHVFIPYNYTCGPEPGCPSCPSGLSCVSHQCISNDINCPSSGQVGENKTCQLTENNTACTPDQNCTATVKTPDGKVFSVVPDEDGNVKLPLTIQGKYTVTLLKDGQVVKQVFVDAVPKSAPTEPEKPSAAGPDAFTILWLLILLAIVVGAVIYWRGRGGKK